MDADRKLASTPIYEGECPHGVRYTYRWTWRPWLGETEAESEPEFVEGPECDECYPPEEE